MGKSLKATYKPNNRQHVIAFRAQLLLLPCLCAALGDLGYSEQGHRKYNKQELLNIDFFYPGIGYQDKCQKFICPVETDPEKMLVQVHGKGNRDVLETRNFSILPHKIIHENS